MYISNIAIAKAMTPAERKEFLALSKEIENLEKEKKQLLLGSAIKLGRLEAKRNGLVRRIERRIIMSGG